MSFSFGSSNQPTTQGQGGGFSFGNQTAGNAFGFGAKPTASSTSSGFSFGGVNPTTTPIAGTTGFGFGSQATTAQPSAFAFGSTKSTLAASSQPAAPGFSFGNAAMSTLPSTQPPAFGFGTSTLAQAPKPAFGFGGTTTATTTAGYSFGSSAPAASQPPSFGFGASSGAVKPLFGSTTAASTSQQPAQGSFNFASPIAKTTPQTSGFSLNQGPALTFGQPATTANPPPFGGALATHLTAPKPALNFGTTASLSSTNQPNLSVGFQQNPSSNVSSSSTGFQLGIKPAPSTAASLAPASGGLQFGSTTTSSSTGFQLGGINLGTAVTSVTPAATGLPNFGLTSGVLGGLTSATTTPAVAPSAGSFFGKPLQAPTAASTTPSTQPTTSTINLHSLSTAAPSSGGFKLTSSLSLGGALPIATTASTSKPSAATAGFSLPPSTVASASVSGFKLTSSTTPASTASGLKLPTTTTTQVSTTIAPTSTAGVYPALRYKDLETKINKWTGVLEQQEHLFLTQATQVNAWNKLLIENSEKITTLNSEFERVQCDQERLNQELDFIKTQQQELEGLLLPLEDSTRQHVTSLSSSVHTHHADVERERTYNLAENIDGQLKRMVQDLREVIDHVNTTSEPADASNPVNQISKILSAHMDSLQWLDSNSGALQHKLDQLTKQVNDRKMEQESRFRLAFD